MQTEHAIVIDNKGYKIEFVLVDFIQENQVIKEIPQVYSLKKNESLVYTDISVALSMTKPRWSGVKWEEPATPEEIEAANPEHFEPMDQPPTEIEMLAAEMSMTMMEIQEEISIAIAELSMAIAMKGGN